MLQTKYITLDEFNEYFPECDLRVELGTEQKALAFLKRIEDRMEAYINSNTHRNIARIYPSFTDYQKEKYKLALLEQAIYVFRNGEISVDSGLDTDNGVIVKKSDLKALTLAQNAIDNLRLCGIWSRRIVGSRDAVFPLW